MPIPALGNAGGAWRVFGKQSLLCVLTSNSRWYRSHTRDHTQERAHARQAAAVRSTRLRPGSSILAGALFS